MSASGHRFPDRIAIVGIGETAYTRHGGATDSEFELCCQAVLAAAADAGIDASDIDGFCSFANERQEPVVLQQTLGIPALRFSNIVWGAGGGGACGSVLNAALALHAGICRYVVVYRSICQGQFERFGHYRIRPWGSQWMAPYGLMSPAQMVALTFNRYLHENGASADHLAEVALAFRAHAQQNPRAVTFGHPLSLEQYQRSRLIADPFRALDCCLETDGACALILTTADRARDTRSRPVHLLAAAQASGPGWGQGPMGSHNMPLEDYASTNSRLLARDLFAMAGIRPADIDVAQLYDAFTGVVTMALEDFGVCERGQAPDFIEQGNLRWPNGRLPANTSGGLLSESYLQGLNLVIEGVRQMRGESTCQVPAANTCLVTSGGANAHKSALILARQAA
jgi:acetyl-CoA acetyltransferase